jgi:hypothetical protein
MILRASLHRFPIEDEQTLALVPAVDGVAAAVQDGDAEDLLENLRHVRPPGRPRGKKDAQAVGLNCPPRARSSVVRAGDS